MSDLIRVCAEKVLVDLVKYYYANKPYYLSTTMNELFTKTDGIHVNQYDVINHIYKLLSEKYTLEVTPTVRTFTGLQVGDKDFTFEDIELKIILTNPTNIVN